MMGETLNIANAILIIGTAYFYFVYNMDIIITVLAVIFAVSSWSYHGFTKERQRYWKAKIALIEPKTITPNIKVEMPRPDYIQKWIVSRNQK